MSIAAYTGLFRVSRGLSVRTFSSTCSLPGTGRYAFGKANSALGFRPYGRCTDFGIASRPSATRLV